MTPSVLPATETLRRLPRLQLQVAEAGRRGDPLVILLHGFPDLWPGWHFQIPPLTADGFRVLAPNQRGYGHSDKPSGLAAYDLSELAQDVIDLADSEGATSFRLVGHDWGGIIAWWVAAHWPERVSQLVILNAPHPGRFGDYARRHPTQMLRSLYIAFFQLPWLPERLLRLRRFELLFQLVRGSSRAGVFDDSDRRYLVDGWSQPGALTAMLNYYRALVRRSEASLQRRVRVPTLILFGRNDPTEEPGLAEASQALCDDSRIVWLNDAAHWIQREEPEVVNAELLRFFSRDPTPRANVPVNSSRRYDARKESPAAG